MTAKPECPAYNSRQTPLSIASHLSVLPAVRPVLWLVAAVMFSIALAACGDSSDSSSGSLVVYSGRSESLVGPIIEQFAEASGVDVSVKYGGTSELAATLQEEGDNSPADVFFAQDPGGLGAVSDMLAALPEDLMAIVPVWAQSPNRNWVGISGRARVIVYNTENVAQGDLPQSLQDLTDDKWKGRIGWAPGNASFQTMVSAMRASWGEDATRQYLSDIQANEPKIYPKNTPIVAAAAAGEVDVGLVNHYYLHRFLQEEGEDFAARNLFLKDGGPGSLVMVAGAGIIEDADNQENAERFLRFLLSKVAQQYFAGQTFEYPLVDGVTTHRLIPPIDELNGPDIDVADMADVEGTQALLRDLGIIP